LSDYDNGGGEEGPEIENELLPLDAWHRAKGGRMVPFAGYEMPVQYEGIMAEHLWAIWASCSSPATGSTRRSRR
jgi:hypothetical protein